MQKAMDFFEKGCNGGNRNGCFNLSAVFLMGRNGVEKDMKKAFGLSLRSCELGHPWSCANVSRMYTLGDGVEKNLKEAEKYKKLAKKYSGYEVNL
jgi:cytochrome c oxidase assembly factor 7